MGLQQIRHRGDWGDGREGNGIRSFTRALDAIVLLTGAAPSAAQETNQPNSLRNEIEGAELDLEDSQLRFYRDVVELVDDLSDDYCGLFEISYEELINRGHVDNLTAAGGHDQYRAGDAVRDGAEPRFGDRAVGVESGSCTNRERSPRPTCFRAFGVRSTPRTISWTPTWDGGARCSAFSSSRSTTSSLICHSCNVLA